MKNGIRLGTLCVLLCVGTLSISKELKPPVDRKMKLCYHEGGSWETYPHHLVATVQELMDLGWIDPFPMPNAEGALTQQLWLYFVESLNKRSAHLEFVEDCYWSSEWDPEKRQKDQQNMLHRLNQKGIDLIMAMGTWAGQNLANKEHQVPTVVMSTSDPLASGIIQSVDDSGLDHLHAKVSPFRFERHIEVFHRAVQFKTLGLPFENTASGKSYAAYDIVYRIAKRLNFKVIECEIPVSGGNTEKDFTGATQCLKDFVVRGVDAVYLTEHTGLQLKYIKSLMSILNSHGIKTFAQGGSKYVQQGVLMSMTTNRYELYGKFYAQVIARILNGESPRSIPQVFEEPIRISLNVQTANQVGFRFTDKNLSLVDTFYGMIE